MSYIRCGYPLIYVEGNSEDYVFCSVTQNYPRDKRTFIEDYGKISDTGIVELLFKNWKTDDIDLKNHLLKRLADRLNVKLRKKPLIDKQWFKLSNEIMEEFEKQWNKKN